MSVSKVSQATQSGKTALSGPSRRSDHLTVEVDGKSYTFTLLKNKDGSYSLLFNIRPGDNLFRVSLAARKVVSKLSGASLCQSTASQIASANGISDVTSVSVNQVVSVGISGYKQKVAAREKPKVNRQTQPSRPPVDLTGIVSKIATDPKDALALSFILKVGGKKLGTDKAMLIWNSVKECSSRYGIDPLFILCLMARESAFDQNAVSVDGCQGLMQISPKTAEKIGIAADDLTDIKKSVEAGTRYLVDYCDIRQNAVLGLAGYNAGPERAERAIDSYFSKKFADYGQINFETYDQTKHYLFCISNAYKELKNGDFEEAARHSRGVYTKTEMIAFIRDVRAGKIQLSPFQETVITVAGPVLK